MAYRLTALLIAAGVCATWSGPARAQITPDGGSSYQAAARPEAFVFTLQPEPETVYAPPAPLREGEGINEGGVNLQLNVAYFTDYIFRGIEIFEPPGREDRANLQISGKLSFDLGRAPHPFVGVFVNVAEADPVSTFQEIRPTVGFDWTVRPLIVSAGYTSFIYPDRDEFETQEIWGRLELDDSYFLRTDRPLLSPYIFAAYDIDLYDGWYIEAGVGHNFEIDNTGLIIRAEANVAYVHRHGLFDADPLDGERVSGFQHYQVGLIGSYSLNRLLNISRRYGDWSFVGYLYYTDGIDRDLRATDQLWGGAGINFRY